MKRKIIQIVFLIFSVLSYSNVKSQGRTGFKLSALQKEFSTSPTLTNFTSEGEITLSVDCDNFILIYHFDRDSVNDVVHTLPKTDEDLGYLIGIFDEIKEYQGFGKWLEYSNGKVFETKMLRDEGYSYFITYLK